MIDTKYTISSNSLYQELDGEAVILNTKSGQYYSLNEVGTRIWELLSEGLSKDEIVSAITEEYEVSPEQAVRDVSELIKDLITSGLVEES